MGQIPPKLAPLPPSGDPYAKSQPKTIQSILLKEFDYPSGKVYVLRAGLMDVEAYLFSEFEDGKDYTYRDEKIFIKEHIWTVLLLRFS